MMALLVGCDGEVAVGGKVVTYASGNSHMHHTNQKSEFFTSPESMFPRRILAKRLLSISSGSERGFFYHKR